MKYAWIKDNSDSFHVAAMCRAFQVSRSGYYRWLKAEPSLRTLRSQRIHASVRQVYEESHQIYGSHKIADQLEKDDTLEAACRNTVATAMREMSLKSRVSKKFSPTTTVTDPSKMPAPNILDQSFTADAPNRKWVTDDDATTTPLWNVSSGRSNTSGSSSKTLTISIKPEPTSSSTSKPSTTQREFIRRSDTRTLTNSKNNTKPNSPSESYFRCPPVLGYL